MVLLMGKIVVNVVRLYKEALVQLRMRRGDKALQACNKIVYARAGARAYRHNRDAQLKRKLLAVYAVALLFNLVHHVQRQYHRALKLHQLYGKIKIALQVRGIHNVYYRVRVFVYDIIARYYFLH